MFWSEKESGRSATCRFICMKSGEPWRARTSDPLIRVNPSPVFVRLPQSLTVPDNVLFQPQYQYVVTSMSGKVTVCYNALEGKLEGKAQAPKFPPCLTNSCT